MRRTRKHRFNVPSCEGVDKGVHIKHSYGGGKAVRVALHRAGPQVKPLDPHTLFLVLREILTAKTKGYRRQKTLKETKGCVVLICTSSVQLKKTNSKALNIWFDVKTTT